MPVIGHVPGNRRADPPAANDQKLHGISVLDGLRGRVRPLGCAGFRYRAAVVTGTSPIRIGLLGYGTVGSAVHRLLREGAESIERVTGQPVEVAAALVRDPARHADAPDGRAHDRLRTAARRSHHQRRGRGDGRHRARPAQYVLALLGAGKSVVSANKQLLSQHGDELFGAAERNGVQLRFEASVCAAIPVVKVLRESMIVTNVHRIDGIVNGTTNFILTRMIQSGAPYAEALAEAQALGYAEADPTEDVTGADAAAKIAHPGVDRVPHADAAGGGRSRRHQPARPGRRGARRRARVRGQADRIGLAVRWRGGGAGASLPAGGEPPAGGRRRRLQRGDAAGQLDPRGDPGGARAPAARRRPRP